MKLSRLALLAITLAIGAQGGAMAQQQPRNGLAQSPTGAYLAGRFANKVSDYAAGVAYIDRALALNPGDGAMQFLAFRMRIAAGKFASAMELAPKISEQFPQDPIAPLTLAIEAARKKDYTGAEKALARIPSTPQLGFMRPYLLAWVKVGQKDYAAAMASLESSAPQAQPGKPSAVFLLHSGLVDEIAGRKDDPEMMERAFAAVAQALRDGQLVGIFPEGRITDSGEIQPFRPGIARILAATPVPVVPMALRGLWGSFFSRKDAPAMTRPFRRGVWSRIGLAVAPPVAAELATPEALQAQVRELRGGWR